MSPCGNSEQLEDTAKLSYHVKEGGVIVTDSASNGDKVVTEFAPSGKCVCCLAENETQGEHCYHNIKHRGQNLTHLCTVYSYTDNHTHIHERLMHVA